MFGIQDLTFLCTEMIINSRGWVLFLQYNKTITCFTTLLRFLFTTKLMSNKFKLSKVYCSLYNTHICPILWWRSMTINSFIIIGYLIDVYYKPIISRCNWHHMYGLINKYTLYLLNWSCRLKSYLMFFLWYDGMYRQ